MCGGEPERREEGRDGAGRKDRAASYRWWREGTEQD